MYICCLSAHFTTGSNKLLVFLVWGNRCIGLKFYSRVRECGIMMHLTVFYQILKSVSFFLLALQPIVGLYFAAL